MRRIAIVIPVLVIAVALGWLLSPALSAPPDRPTIIEEGGSAGGDDLVAVGGVGHAPDLASPGVVGVNGTAPPSAPSAVAARVRSSRSPPTS